ncbi:hypothetical protein [Caballeronia sp. SL2Y3]|uniref:hypothetical protein n=1 Tax=Caballeronia sp. SL2Y3 TaxID=2878151 RepID=UPI001FD3F9A8|nr:hypothetical protein [Caballeronia sp. SL2Y3]
MNGNQLVDLVARLRIALIAIALTFPLIANAALGSSRAAHPVKTVQSSHPPYVANVADGHLLSIALPPMRLRLDMNAANSIRSETGDFKPARYSFPEARVPQSVLSSLTDIYRYDRRRDVPIVSSGGDWVIAEYFRAGSHVPVVRFQLLGKQVQRQEVLDRTGKAVEIVTVGWTSSTAKDDEDTTEPSTVDTHPAWIRVFKVSPAGQKTLVALAWRKTRFLVAPDRYATPEDTELVFGLPDGKSKWRTKAEFLKACNIDLDAKSLGGPSASTPPHSRSTKR